MFSRMEAITCLVCLYIRLSVHTNVCKNLCTYVFPYLRRWTQLKFLTRLLYGRHSIHCLATYPFLFFYLPFFWSLFFFLSYSLFSLFLVAKSNSIRGFVHPSVCPSVRPSVCRSVTRFSKITNSSKLK